MNILDNVVKSINLMKFKEPHGFLVELNQFNYCNVFIKNNLLYFY